MHQLIHGEVMHRELLIIEGRSLVKNNVIPVHPTSDHPMARLLAHSEGEAVRRHIEVHHIYYRWI